MKAIFLFVLVSFIWMPRAYSQSEGIQWKSWVELEQNLAENPKPVFIFFHAKWCAYCKKIERQIFTKPEIIKKINAHYYAVKMDVECTDTITFEGVQFKNKQALKKRNGIHEIPLLLASREEFPFSLPATVILNKDFTLKKRLFEYYTSKQLMDFLK